MLVICFGRSKMVHRNLYFLKSSSDESDEVFHRLFIYVLQVRSSSLHRREQLDQNSFGAASLVPQCAEGPGVDFVKMQILIQLGWGVGPGTLRL